MVFCVVWWNALDRPRSCDSGIPEAMYRDGFLYFSVSVSGLAYIHTDIEPPDCRFFSVGFILTIIRRRLFKVHNSVLRLVNLVLAIIAPVSPLFALKLIGV